VDGIHRIRWSASTGLCIQEEIHTYRMHEEETYHLRGTLLIERQLQMILARPRLLCCRIGCLDTDNPLNQLLHWAGQALLTRTFDSSVWRTLSAILGRLPKVTSGLSYPLHIPGYLPHQYEHYREAFDIAVALARGYGYGQLTGNQAGYGYILNMERTFEGFVENSLRVVARSMDPVHSWECVPQESSLFASAATRRSRDYYTRPDNKLLIHGEVALLVDAKYKRAPDLSSGHKRPENTDLYQLFASLVAHNCRRALIVYPQVQSDEGDVGPGLRAWCVRLAHDYSVLIAATALNVSDLATHQKLRQAQQELLAAVELVLGWQLGT
jgi:5-methylcytosine-specific restriction endonuclease McrBC regulatory subunit McrC